MAPSRRSGWALTSARRVVPFAAVISSSIDETVSPWSARYDGSRSGGSGVPSTARMRRRSMRSAGRSPGGMAPRRLRPTPFVNSRPPSAAMMKMPSLTRSTRVRSRAACSAASRSSWRAPVTSWNTETLPVRRPSASRSGTVLTRNVAGQPSRSIVSSAPITACACASARRIGCSAGASAPPSGVRAGSRSRRSLTGRPTSRAAPRTRAAVAFANVSPPCASVMSTGSTRASSAAPRTVVGSTDVIRCSAVRRIARASTRPIPGVRAPRSWRARRARR